METRSDFTPVIWDGVQGGRFVKKRQEYNTKYKGIEGHFVGDWFVLTGINRRDFLAIHQSKLKNVANMLYKAAKLSEEDINA